MKIPRYFSQVELPTHIPYQEPQPDLERSQAIAGVGQAFRYVTKEVGDFLQAKRSIDESLEAATLFNEARQRVYTVETELQKNPNEETHVPLLQKAMGEIGQDVLGRAKSRNVQVALQKAMSDLAADRTKVGLDFSLKTYLAKSAGLYAKNLFQYGETYASTPDLAERARIEGEAEALIKGISATLGRDPDEDLRNWKRHSESSAVKNDMILDPKGTRDKLKAGEYKGIWSEDRPVLIRQAEELMRVREAEEHKIRVDQGGKKLMELYGTDYPSAFKALSNTKYLKDNNLTFQEAHDIESMLAAKYQKYLADRDMTYDKTDQEATVLFADGQLTPQWIKVKVANDKMDGKQGRIWLEILESHAVRGVRNNDQVSIAIFNMIQGAGGDVTKLNEARLACAKAAKNGQINYDRYKDLINMTNEANQKIFGDKNYQFADKFMKEQLGWKSDLMGFIGSDEQVAAASQAYYEANMELRNAVEKDNLQGQDIYKKATEIIIPYRDRVNLFKIMGIEKPGASPAQKPKSPDVISEVDAATAARLGLGDPKAYFKKYGNIPLESLTDQKRYRTDGKTWWEVR